LQTALVIKIYVN